MCLDHFIYNLNMKSLDHQLSVIEKEPLLRNNFKEVALKFKESGRPSVEGEILEINKTIDYIDFD